MFCFEDEWRWFTFMFKSAIHTHLCVYIYIYIYYLVKFNWTGTHFVKKLPGGKGWTKSPSKFEVDGCGWFRTPAFKKTYRIDWFLCQAVLQQGTGISWYWVTNGRYGSWRCSFSRNSPALIYVDGRHSICCFDYFLKDLDFHIISFICYFLNTHRNPWNLIKRKVAMYMISWQVFSFHTHFFPLWPGCLILVQHSHVGDTSHPGFQWQMKV